MLCCVVFHCATDNEVSARVCFGISTCMVNFIVDIVTCMLNFIVDIIIHCYVWCSHMYVNPFLYEMHFTT